MFNKTYLKVGAYTNIEGNAGSSKRSYTKIYLANPEWLIFF